MCIVLHVSSLNVNIFSDLSHPQRLDRVPFTEVTRTACAQFPPKLPLSNVSNLKLLFKTCFVRRTCIASYFGLPLYFW